MWVHLGKHAYSQPLFNILFGIPLFACGLLHGRWIITPSSVTTVVLDGPLSCSPAVTPATLYPLHRRISLISWETQGRHALSINPCLVTRTPPCCRHRW